MARHLYIGMLLVALSAGAGCFSNDGRNQRTQSLAPPKPLPPASELANTRTYTVYSKLLADNPDIAAQLATSNDPTFTPPPQVVGWPGVGIYHQGAQLYITQGLVNRCETDGKNESQLAAILASELAKMVVENDYQKKMRNTPAEGDRTFSPHVTSENRYSDQTDVATMGFAERDPARRRDPAKSAPNQDPKVLARNYLNKSNFSPDAMTRVAPLICEAEKNPELEKFVNPRTSGIGGLSLFSK
jgi:hypothetical protein